MNGARALYYNELDIAGKLGDRLGYHRVQVYNSAVEGVSKVGAVVEVLHQYMIVVLPSFLGRKKLPGLDIFVYSSADFSSDYLASDLDPLGLFVVDDLDEVVVIIRDIEEHGV